MKTTDLFKNNRAANRINESLAKTFGRKLNLESFDLPQLEDARNKLRTQIHTARTASGFNETVENDAFTEAQWMLDAINSEIAEREEFVADAHTAELEEGPEFGAYDYEKLAQQVFDQNPQLSTDGRADELTSMGHSFAKKMFGDKEANYLFRGEDFPMDFVSAYSYLQDGGKDNEPEPDFDQEYNDESIGSDHVDSDEKMKRMGAKSLSTKDKLKMMPDQMRAMARGDSEDDLANYNKMKAKRNEAYDEPEAPDAEAIARRKRLQAIKDRREDELASGDDTPSRKRTIAGRAYGGAAQKDDAVDEAGCMDKRKKNESIQGDNMATLREGEIQQAQSIVTAKTMVDRVGRWIEELSGMENDTLLQLGDQIRDEQGQEQAKGFISSVAPAIQQALNTLKGTREALATGVRTLTGEEQGAEMLGAEPEAAPVDDFDGAAEPDAMNAEVPADDFAAAEPAAGGAGDTGRAKRESIDRSNSLLKVLAG